MFLPPEQRHPGASPWDPPPAPKPSSRDDAVVIALVLLLVFAVVMAPMAGSSVLEAIWFVLRH